MDKEAECCSTHLIERDGTFNAVGLDKLIKQVKLAACGLDYVVVAIIGPQSSGKSTLLNNLFRTNFREMDAINGRSQTTKGIWIARCPDIEPCTIVMDLEGTDGRERGQDDTAFEKQSALFALAVSDIVLINMWCHDIGRENAANKPLLQTIFQVMLKLFSPLKTTRKTTLMFVIRDKTKTPLEILEHDLIEGILKIWDSVSKTEAHKHTPFSEFFNVQVVALPNYEHEKDQFIEQVAALRQKLVHSIAPGGLAGDRRGVVHASVFSLSAQEYWKAIKENKDLDLPSHKVMVATIRCEEIFNEKYSSFVSNEDWIHLEKDVQSNFVPGFGKKLSSLLNKCLDSYDGEATYFEDSVRSAKRKQLEEKLLQLVQPTYQLMLEHIRSGTLENFKKALTHALIAGQGFAVAARDCTEKFTELFDKQCEDAVIKQAKWNSEKRRNKFSHDLDSHILEVRTAKLSELTALYESKLKEGLYGPVGPLLDGGNDDTWPGIRKLLHQVTETVVSEFSFALSGFEMDEEEKEDMIKNLKTYARGVVEGKTIEEAAKVLLRMKERFRSIFNYDNDSMSRVWSEKDNIPAITNTAQLSSLKLLSVLAAIRLDEESDSIEGTLVRALVNPKKGTNKSVISPDPLASITWEEGPATKTLITPVQCKSLWSQFQKETEYQITQAIASQEMVGKVRCDEISNEMYSSFVSNKDWIDLEEVVESNFVTGFGKRLSSLLDKCLARYDEEATYIQDIVRFAKRKQLEEKLLQRVKPTYQLMLEHIRSGTLKNFKKALSDAMIAEHGFAVAARECTTNFTRLFDKKCEDAVIKQAKWDSGETRNKFSDDLDSHILEVRTAKLSERIALYKSKLKEGLYDPVETLLEQGSDDTWFAIRKLFHQVSETGVSEFSSALSGFEMDVEEKEDMSKNLKNYAREVVEGKAREEAENVLNRMKERFTSKFNLDNDSIPRDWTTKEDIRAITKMARSSSLKLLSVLAAIRLDEQSDTIEDTLVLVLMDPNKGTNNITISRELLASNTWKELPATKTLITPLRCISLWSKFQKETKYTITQAIATSKKAKKRNNRSKLRGSVKIVTGVVQGAVGIASLASSIMVPHAVFPGVAALALATKNLVLGTENLFRGGDDDDDDEDDNNDDEDDDNDDAYI